MIRRKISTDPAGWVLIFSFGRRSFSSDRPFAAKDDLFAPFFVPAFQTVFSETLRRQSQAGIQNSDCRIIWSEVNDMLKDCGPEELSYLSTSFAVAIAKGQDIHSLRVLCSFFTNVIATLNVIINQQALIDHHRHKHIDE
ncbi:hypothetical protein [Faecalispora sporosphaeroides]|uniref:hypothetical protein n=1 Tax=Faecalispora sporosphaeroides TaxID=1549 RepID=UPI002DD6389C|nr:hypothetical protein [Faecalispora sporosphaeroides]